MPFEQGHKKIGGRKKGTPNKTTTIIRENILEAFDRVGSVDYLIQVAKDDPKTFCTLLGKLLPAEIKEGLRNTQPVIIRVDTGITNSPPVGIVKLNNFITDE